MPTDEHRWVVHGIDVETGAIKWEREVHRGVPHTGHHLKNTFASATPVTDGDRVYAYFGNVGLFCLSLDGRLLWSLPIEPSATRLGWGMGASPVLHDDRIYIVNDNDNDDQSYLVALSKETGAELWRVDRDEGTNWSTPYIWENDRRTEIVTTGTGKVRSYDLDGNLLWELTGMSSSTVTTPFSRFGLLYISSGYIGDRKRPVLAIRPGASGDITVSEGQILNESVAWFQPQSASYNPSPLIYGDYYYTLLDRGYLTCHDARTGEEVYGRQRIEVGAAFTSSPWAYDGKIFALSEDGDTYVIKAGMEFEVLGTNSLGEFTIGDAGDRARESVHPDRIEALPDHGRRWVAPACYNAARQTCRWAKRRRGGSCHHTVPDVLGRHAPRRDTSSAASGKRSGATRHTPFARVRHNVGALMWSSQHLNRYVVRKQWRCWDGRNAYSRCAADARRTTDCTSAHQ